MIRARGDVLEEIWTTPADSSSALAEALPAATFAAQQGIREGT
jgi:hypothetical protein